MTHEDQIARMYEIMAKLAQIENEREMILRRREREGWRTANAKSLGGKKSWVTRRLNLALKKEAA